MSSPDPSPPSSRVVRVFVSSTFQDMHAERDVLVKRVFPVLRKRCEGRGVVWGEVDLRWGVTDEEKAEGKVLPICMAQIRRCRPYFIGLLGERYGWVPEEIPADVRAREPWLGEYGDRSVTELEILGGVLGARGLSEQALFYLRDPAYVDRLAEAEQPHFREGPTAEEIARYGPTEAGRRAEARRAKLAALKARIRQEAAERGMVLRDGYPDPEALADLVRQDLEAIIDRLYPEASKPAPLDQEAALHEAFAAGRARVYVARPALFERLDAHVAGEGPPLAVVGESGMGKSALLANWALGYRDRNPEAQIVLHFVGASAASADWQAMLRRLLAEFNRRLDLGLEVPDEAGALRATFATALHRVAARTRLVLVVDALNQLEDREGSPDLAWLPPVVPPNVRLLVSTLDGRPREAWSRRGWPTLGVAGLGEDERRQLIAAHLAQYAKALPPDQVARLAAAPQTANPLFLRALLEELRLHGDHWTLRDRLDHYLGAPAIPELYGRILRRYEADYEGARPGLVRDATTLLWAARRGLSEAELLALLGTGDDPLPQSEWAPLFLAAEEGLVDRSGLVGFSHDHLRRAVQLAYLPEQEARDAAHLRLAEHFDRDRLSNRAVDELPWQLAAAGRWEELADLLADLPFLERAWGRDEFGVLASWSQVERNSDRRLVEAYRQVVREPSEGGSATGAIAVLCWHTGHGEESLALFRYFEQESRSKGDLAGLQVSLGDQAMILYRRGDLNGAVALLKEQERICRELGNPAGLSVSLGNQAPILQVRGDLDGAMALMKDQERICRELGDPVGLSQSICNQALILHDRGDLDGAMALMKEQERICRELGDPAGLQRSLGNQALILRDRGDLDGAMALHKDEERICRELGDPAGLSLSFGNQALILHDRGDLDGAMALYKEQERICRELGDLAGLSASLGGQALILRDRGDLDGALALMKEQERICRELGDPAGLQVSLGNQALILRARGDLDGAMALHKDEERTCRELRDPAGLSRSLGNQAGILLRRGDLNDAMALMKEQERICRELGDLAGLSASLGNQALVLQSHGDLDGAMVLHKDQEKICRELGDSAGLSVSLGNQAGIVARSGDLDGALALMKEQERICRELGDPAGLQVSLGNQALVLQSHGDLDGALALMKEQEQICRELGDPAGLSRSLGNQALILQVRGDLDGAMALLKEQERICRELGDPAGLQASLGNQALILRARGDLDGAMALMKEQERICRELGDPAGLQASLGNQALILHDRGDLDGAMALLKDRERLCRELGDPAGLQVSLGNQAVILHSRGDLDGAMVLLGEQEALCRTLGDPSALQRCLKVQEEVRRMKKEA